MRSLDKHKVPGAKSNIDVAQVEPNIYRITLPAGELVLDFTAGLTNEALAAVLFDRLGLQVDQVFDGRSAGARYHLHHAIEQLKRRTEDRINGGVEGTKEPTPGPTGQK